HDRTALIITPVFEAFEIQRAVAQATFAIIKVSIQRAGVNDMIIALGHFTRERRIQTNADIFVINHVFNKRGIDMLRHALEAMEKVVVIVIETHRQPLEYLGWQLRWLTAPLFLGIAFKKSLIQILAHKTQRLLFERLRVFNTGIRLCLDESTRFIRA